jgi:hypothetical protein
MQGAALAAQGGDVRIRVLRACRVWRTGSGWRGAVARSGPLEYLVPRSLGEHGGKDVIGIACGALREEV